ncbi:hypothetical protein WQ53_10705 [Pseudoxanthomonas suwonensis]|uniref:Uncharacterized protein n=1 Tax=Pseudoxanthomonas suwonensis TaxID=314722 RepID=A0A0E3Z245_9GAMM|nr:hypothetical protein WQ53_10705 [Pseudoxanthomonas suwonensis]
MVAVLLSRILAIAYKDNAPLYVDLAPADTTDLLLTHRAGNSKAHDPTHWNLQLGVVVEVVEQALEFIGGWAPVALSRLSDQAQSFEGEPC